jgi:NTE family protein
MQEEELKIGLALSGGGARGAAHIGVIRALLEHDIVPNVIAGTSAGSVAGVLYAAGQTPDEMLDFVAKSSVYKLIKVGIPRTGLTNLTYLRQKLIETIRRDRFESLRYPLHVAITNLNTGQVEIRSSGVLFDVIVASCSLPFVFKPVLMDGQLYVDGGVMSNLPVRAIQRRADLVIGVNLIPRCGMEDREMTTVIGIMQRCFDLSVISNTTPEAERCDILLEPLDLRNYHIFQLNKYQEMHDLGYQDTLKRIPEIRNRIASLREGVSG